MSIFLDVLFEKGFAFWFIFFDLHLHLLSPNFNLSLPPPNCNFHLPPTTRQWTDLEPVGNGVLQVRRHLHLWQMTSALQTTHVVVDFKEHRQSRKTFLEMLELGDKCSTCCIFMFSMFLFYVLHDPDLLMDIEFKYLQLVLLGWGSYQCWRSKCWWKASGWCWSKPRHIS